MMIVLRMVEWRGEVSGERSCWRGSVCSVLYCAEVSVKEVKEVKRSS